MLDLLFGFRAQPFQLNPDPSFYFESEGHGKVLNYLKFGIHQREGFMVVTGDIGSGKTTLARALIQGLDPSSVAAGHVVSTQVDAYGLLYAVAMAFAVRIVPTANKAQLLGALETHFALLASRGRHALLVVDEAHHLGVAELEELRMLSNFQSGHKALLQSFLVGQTELRDKLRLPELEQLRQRIIASCHLGPLSALEVRNYVRHRLMHVGWKGDRPRIDDDAFLQVHGRTGGVPRRINVLCTRALLGCWIAESNHITAPDVAKAADEIAQEL